MLDLNSDVEKTKKIKADVATIQNQGISYSPVFALAGQPQSIRIKSEFIKDVTSEVSILFKKEGTPSLVSIVAYATRCNTKFIQGQLAMSLRGKINHSVLVDTNHVTKNFCYQGVRELCTAIIGDYVLDPLLSQLVGMKEKTQRGKDQASDLFVLMLANLGVVVKIDTLVN